MEELRDSTGDQCRAKVGDNSQISMSPHSRLTDPRGKEGQEIKEAKEKPECDTRLFSKPNCHHLHESSYTYLQKALPAVHV